MAQRPPSSSAWSHVTVAPGPCPFGVRVGDARLVPGGLGGRYTGVGAVPWPALFHERGHQQLESISMAWNRARFFPDTWVEMIIVHAPKVNRIVVK